MSLLLRTRRPFLALILALPGIVIPVVHCGGTTEHTQGFPENHVPVAPTCPSTRPPGLTDAGSADGGMGVGGTCHVDADCTQGKNGRCGLQGHFAGDMCSYDACFTDSDCGNGKACICSESGNACVEANCQTDADCGGLGCSTSYGTSCGAFGGTAGQYCHTSSDECVDDKDCKANGMTGFCAHAASHWACFYTICAG